ncbi:M20 family peptidase [Lacihabitans sp. LS3-19]|uniref:M20/M25/M40 family metallo-hydrolase n=1 Tax=Lacihabitans sp. LS3-19 TaxID=2487335 RepID=UPI0020CDFFA3|nr:M20/M25/M40 family metallo-hydrolase [Lacihabitans sp. LS3-19]MCP9767469.1 M20 family peptidase [Lacihabitans sp. LS3-19]
MKKLVFTALACLMLTSVFSQKLSTTEEDLIKSVEKNYEKTFKLLEEVVNINSGTLNKEGVKQVGDIFKREFEKIGFATEWVSLPDSLNRAGHFVATRKGTKGKKLFLIGHLDTVFEKSMEFSPFTIISDSIATGQGANDMKGGDVMILASLQALNEYNLLDDRHITVYFTGDEESSGKPTSISRADFIERAKECDIALAYETTAGFGIATTARRGASGWTLVVTGKQAHSSGVFSQNVGYGSIYEAARILNTFRETLSKEKYLTFNPGQIVGGSFVNYDETEAKGISLGKTNIVAKRTIVTGDLRFLTEDQKINARKKMVEITKKSLNQTSAHIKFSDGIPSMPPTEGNRNIMKVLNQISLDLGMGPVKEGDPGSRGAGDISYVSQYLDCLDGLGSSGSGAHTPAETINIKEYPKLIKRSTLLMYRLLK